MKNIFICIFFCLVLVGGTDWVFSRVSHAEDYETKVDNESQAVKEGGYDYQEGDPITQEMIDQEEEWLEQKINEINETPVEEFGSLVLKRKERVHYAHRLELLRENPEQYFKTKTDESSRP